GTAVFPDGHTTAALSADEMAEIVNALAGNQIPRTEVLAKAQQATQSDAAFQLSAAGEDIPGDSTGERVAKGGPIALFFAIVVVALIIASKGNSAPSRAAGAVPRTAGVRVGAPLALVHPALIPIPVYGPPPPPGQEGQSGLGVSMRLLDLRQPRLLWS